LLFGYDPEQQKIVGFYVLESKETPGIGDKIEKDPFLSNMKQWTQL
jgi:electron transport complex protein RnfG